MAENFGSWAQATPADTNEAEFLAPGSGEEYVGVVHVSNTDSSEHTFQVGIKTGGTTYWIEPGDTLPATMAFKVSIEGINEDATLQIKSGSANNITFVFMGLKIT